MGAMVECGRIGHPVLAMIKGGSPRDWAFGRKKTSGVRFGKKQLLSEFRTRCENFHQLRVNFSLFGEGPCGSRRVFEGSHQVQHHQWSSSSARDSSSSASFTLHAAAYSSAQSEAPRNSKKGWDDAKLLAKLRSLAVVSDDRSVMHSDVAFQRDNWGKLLQVTITMSLISAGLLAAFNTRTAAVSFSLSLTSALLAVGATVFMGLENYFQPAQSAEEHRAAARFFRNLVKEIKASLKPGGEELKEEASSFYETKLDKLKHLDEAFPLPLLPGVNKFPKEVKPSVLSPSVDKSQPVVATASKEEGYDNGWSSAIVEDLNRTSDLMWKKDIATYSSWQKNALKINKVLAVAGPLLAGISIVTNFVGGSTGAVVAASCCVLAALCSSFSHDAQVGMVYEMYRQVAGAFVDMDNDIQRNLRMPVDQREDGEIFHQKIALQLGQDEGRAIVRSDDQATAGTLL